MARRNKQAASTAFTGVGAVVLRRMNAGDGSGRIKTYLPGERLPAGMLETMPLQNRNALIEFGKIRLVDESKAAA